jgi:hypothetical protein
MPPFSEKATSGVGKAICGTFLNKTGKSPRTNPELKRKPRNENKPDGVRFRERTDLRVYKRGEFKHHNTASRKMNFERYSQPIQISKRYF